MDKNIETIDEFIAQYPEDVQVILQIIRQTIQEVAPDAKEKISYGIPTFTLNGKNLVHFSAYEKHIGFYPGSAPIKEFEKELSGYKTSKGTVQFPLDRPIPYDLIQKITKTCVKSQPTKVKIFVTGGTIDGLEYSSLNYAPTVKQTIIPKLLKNIGINIPYSINILMNKDSKFITDKDRQIILEQCQKCPEKKIIITHGTVTMVETAKYVQNHCPDKTIILTGAMIPADKKGSDAPNNLLIAFEKIMTLKHGVYISMSNTIFDADNVRKNIEKGIFEKL